MHEVSWTANAHTQKHILPPCRTICCFANLGVYFIQFCFSLPDLEYKYNNYIHSKFWEIQVYIKRNIFKRNINQEGERMRLQHELVPKGELKCRKRREVCSALDFSNSFCRLLSHAAILPYVPYTYQHSHLHTFTIYQHTSCLSWIKFYTIIQIK